MKKFLKFILELFNNSRIEKEESTPQGPLREDKTYRVFYPRDNSEYEFGHNVPPCNNSGEDYDY